MFTPSSNKVCLPLLMGTSSCRQWVNSPPWKTSCQSSPQPQPRCALDQVGRLQTKLIYSWLSTGETLPSPLLAFIWQSHAMPRFFTWLASRDRLQSRVALHKNILFDDICEDFSNDPKTSSHILFNCDFAREFWVVNSINIDNSICCSRLHHLPHHAKLS